MAYRADIEIAVKGAQELKRLQNEIRTAADAVNSLNSSLSGIANLIPRSFDNLNKTVADAAKSFNAAALGTDEATAAARKYVQATDELNAGLRERVALLAKVRAEQRITKPGDAGTGQQTPALPPKLIRTYQIEQNWIKFFQDAAGVAVDLQARSLNTKASWKDFFATAAQAAVSVKANSLNTKASWNDFFATAAQAAVNVKANSLNTKASWNDFFATAAQAAVSVKANSLNTKASWNDFFKTAEQAAVNVKANSLNTKASWTTFFTEAAQLADDLTADIRKIEATRSAAARGKLASAAQTRQERATFLAGAPVSQFPVGPAQASTRRRFTDRTDTSVERAEGALRAKELRAQRALNVQFFAEEKAQILELDRLRTASARKQTQQIQAIGKAVRGSLSSAAIGGAFPLLFGQSPQAAVGGALGGLLGGAGGGFAGSLIGTALGELEAAKARTKELAIELGLTSTQAQTLATAFELAGRNSQQLEAAVTNIQGLGLSTTETASAIKIAVELSKEYGGSVEKIAQSFADTLESGKVSITTLNKFTAQGIPIQDELAKKFGVSRTKLLEMAKDGEISVQQLTDALVKMGREAEATADKGETGFDRFTRAVRDISTAIASAAGALLKILIPALDAVLTKLSAVINRATQAINLVTDAQVGSAESALFKVGMSQGMFGGFAQSKGNIDLLTDGLKTLKPQLASSKEELDKFAGTVQSYQTKLQQFGGSTGDYAVKTAQVELSRVKRDIAARATALKVDTRVPAAAQITDINAPANLPPSGTGSSGRKGPKPPEDRTAQLMDEYRAVEQRLSAENEIRDLLFEGKEARAADTEYAKALAGIELERLNALRGANYAGEKEVINALAVLKARGAELENEDARRAIAQQRFEEELQMQEAVRSSVQAFKDMRTEQELQVQYGKTYSRLLTEGMLPAEAERLANFDKLIAGKLKENEIETGIVTLAIEKAKQEGNATAELEKRLKLLGLVKTAITGEAAAGPGAGPTDRDRLQTEADRVRGELNTLTDPINAITTAAAGIGDAFGTSFKGIISGSMTAKEALANFFTSVADMFLDMAAQIITKMITMSILNAVLGVLPGAGGGGGFGAAGAGFGGSNAFGSSDAGGGLAFGGGLNLMARANGGPVSSGQTYMVGERGPELFVPGRSGTIVPNDKMGGGSTNVVVNVDAKGSSVEGNEQGANQLGRVISAAVQSELIKQQRPGGLLAR